MNSLTRTSAAVAASILAGAATETAAAADYDSVVRVDHYVGVKSTAPAAAGQRTPIYVREVVHAARALRDRNVPNRVVLFIHGAGTPAEVAFDVPYADYSWMEYLAEAGFDVFAMDTTGYGRSWRPAPMNDPCNLSAPQQLALAPDGRTEACAPSYAQPIATLASDWNDIGAVVDHLRTIRGASQVSMVSWSLGGPRAAGYAAQNPDKVARLCCWPRPMSAMAPPRLRRPAPP